MTTQEKKEAVLKFLYDRRAGGNYIDMNELVRRNSSISGIDVSRITEFLSSQNYIKRRATKDGVYAMITEGVEHFEASKADNQYNPKDRIDSDEQEILTAKLDELLVRLKKLELGQQIICDDVVAEIQELKKLSNILGNRCFSGSSSMLAWAV